MANDYSIYNNFLKEIPLMLMQQFTLEFGIATLFS